MKLRQVELYENIDRRERGHCPGESFGWCPREREVLVITR